MFTQNIDYRLRTNIDTIYTNNVESGYHTNMWTQIFRGLPNPKH